LTNDGKTTHIDAIRERNKSGYESTIFTEISIFRGKKEAYLFYRTVELGYQRPFQQGEIGGKPRLNIQIAASQGAAKGDRTRSEGRRTREGNQVKHGEGQ
jgi:hypothetical protein